MHVVLAGQGVSRENNGLATLLAEADEALPGRVHVLGVRGDMPRLNAALDLAAVSSVSGESFSLAAGEAMASGVPCVVTDLTFLPSLVGDTGVVVPRSRPEAIAAGIVRVLQLDEAERRALGLRARERIVAWFSLDTMIDRYRELYRGLTTGRLAP